METRKDLVNNFFFAIPFDENSPTCLDIDYFI